MIRAGEKLGDLRKVLPACREVLRVAPDTVRTTMHYMVAILVLFAPGAIMVITLLTSMVVPKFKEIFAATGTQLWPVAKFVFALNDSGVLTGIEAVLLLMLVGATAFYIGGPRAVRWFQYDRAPVVDWITWRIPWKHKQLLRAFSAMLAVLLDGGVPEAEAVRLAGESTANEICRRRAGRVMAAMQEGAALTEAIRTFDNTGEFHWRMTNAAHAHGGFLDALRGWHAALDARAFQQEETATHMFTSGLVILNGVIVGLVAVGMFGLLVMLLRATIATT
jgi:type II secretory pathway component PulF